MHDQLLSQSTWWHFSRSREPGDFLVGYILACRLEIVQVMQHYISLIFALSFVMVVSLTCVPLFPPPITYQERRLFSTGRNVILGK